MAAQGAQQPPTRGIIKTVSTCFVAFAAVVALIAQLPGAVGAWCDYFGFWCTYDVPPKDISKFVSPGNPCSSSGGPPICLTPTTKYRQLIVDSLKFVPANPLRPNFLYNRFNNGDPKQKPPGGPFSGSGWFPLPDNNSKQVCVISYASTGACEEKYGINGAVTVRERITIF
jgi:hypothetical protein